MYETFESLEVWKRSCDMAVGTYEVLSGCTDRTLRDQMSRSAVSIASNIAEGAERGSNREFVRFLNIAKGSAAELRTQYYIAGRTGCVSQEACKDSIMELKAIARMLYGLIKSKSK